MTGIVLLCGIFGFDIGCAYVTNGQSMPSWGFVLNIVVLSVAAFLIGWTIAGEGKR